MTPNPNLMGTGRSNFLRQHIMTYYTRASHVHPTWGSAFSIERFCLAFVVPLHRGGGLGLIFLLTTHDPRYINTDIGFSTNANIVVCCLNQNHKPVAEEEQKASWKGTCG